MRHNLLMFICAVLIAASPTTANASEDPRILEVNYDPTSVYPITISAGLATVIELQKDEAVESLVVGDATGWLVEATANADRVVVKPSTGANTTNLMVITTKRTYAFTLNLAGGVDVFLVRFSYPDLAPKATYRMRGDRVLYPRSISDNGRTTSVFWNEGAELPVVYTVDADGEEVAVQWRAVGNGIVIDKVHARLIFKRGKSEAVATRRVGG